MAASGKASGKARRSIAATAAYEFFSLEAVDFGQLKQDVSANPIEEDTLMMEAIQLAQQRKFHNARDVAESVLLSNPNNATAIQVNASECESRQDWAEAAKFFLAGMSHNTEDGAMEHGFQTNVDLLRASRPRWLERKVPNKWDDVLTFKPRTIQERAPSTDQKPPWWRLGKKYEELLSDPGYVVDLLETSPDPEEECEEVRRVLWENFKLLDAVYAYYAAELNETWDIKELPTLHEVIRNMVVHDGDETGEENADEMMTMPGLWRIFKDCRMVVSDVKTKMPLAVFNRVYVLGKARLAEAKKEDQTYDPVNIDPHDRRPKVSFYSFVETLMRCAYLKMANSGSFSQRLEALLEEHVKPFALQKQSKKEYLDFKNDSVVKYLTDPAVEPRLRKIYEYFINSYKQNKQRTNMFSLDLTLTMNHCLVMMEKCKLFDPNFNVKRCADCYGAITCDSDLMPQEHPNNQNSEMTFWEFQEYLVRISKLKNSGSKEAIADLVKRWVNDEFIPSAARVIPGKI